LEKFPGYGGKNPQTSDFASCIGSNFPRADAQDIVTSGNNRPNIDTPQLLVYCLHDTYARFSGGALALSAATVG
jgi:hypothetical protein